MKKISLSLITLIISIVMLGTSINTFKSMVNNDEPSLFEPLIFSGLRYFRVGDEGYYKVLNGNMEIHVMDDEYNIVDNFQYDFDNNSLKGYYLYCLKNYPSKVLGGYIDNYLILSGIYETLPYSNKSGETVVGNIQNNPVNKKIF